MRRKFSRFVKGGWMGLLYLLMVFVISGCGKTEVAPVLEVTSISATKPIGATESETNASSQETAIILPVIDGCISQGEWKDAKVERFADGSELLLFQQDGFLFLGIRAKTPGMIAGNVFIASGNKIKILHTSAALGTAIYEMSGEVWLQTQEFDWCCREPFNNEAVAAARTAFLKSKAGWG